MCLDKISKKKPALEGVGYKVFELRDDDGKLYGEMARRDKIRPVGTWLNSRNYSVRKKEGLVTPIKGKYPVGWHIFKSLAGVKSWNYDIDPDYIAIKRVRYRLAHTEGTIDNYKVVVAKEIYIIP
jgi:hypothetical protein